MIVTEIVLSVFPADEEWTLTRDVEMPSAPFPDLNIRFDDEVDPIDDVTVMSVCWAYAEQKYLAFCGDNSERVFNRLNGHLESKSIDALVELLESQGWNVVDRIRHDVDTDVADMHNNT